MGSTNGRAGCHGSADRSDCSILRVELVAESRKGYVRWGLDHLEEKKILLKLEMSQTTQSGLTATRSR